MRSRTKQTISIVAVMLVAAVLAVFAPPVREALAGQTTWTRVLTGWGGFGGYRLSKFSIAANIGDAEYYIINQSAEATYAPTIFGPTDSFYVLREGDVDTWEMRPATYIIMVRPENGTGSVEVRVDME